MRKFFFKKDKPDKETFKDSEILGSFDTRKDALLNEKLKESEIRYRRLFETAQDGILILDFETGNIVDANPFIVEIIGYPLDEILGKKLWEIGLFSNREESERAFIELTKKGYIRFEDMPIQQKNGKTTEVEFISNVYLVNNNKVIQCNIRDITERKHTENALITSEQNLKSQNTNFANLNKVYTALNENLTESVHHIQDINDELVSSKIKADESDNLKSAFLANMSHEIRTPMNAIMGFSEFLLEPGLSKEKLEDFVQIIHASSMQLLSVISDIIDISKIEAGQISINVEVVNINTIMNEISETYKKLVEPKKLNFQYSCNRPNDEVLIKTDGNRIKQVICNLLNNAIKYTKEGSIEFGYHLQENLIEFYVKDTGIGMSPENHELIFQRFRQVAKSESEIYSGNGLGLSISKALVEKLGGNIVVKSQLGIGSTFTFTIPFTEKIESTVNAPLKAKFGRFMHWDEKTILIVEDESNNHSYIQELLSPTSIKMLHAWDGKDAIDQVRKHPDISLVLMDIKMPIMNGYEATRQIKEIRPLLPVIAQTAYALSHDREQALIAGCDDYISKPISKVALVDLIAGYLN